MAGLLSHQNDIALLHFRGADAGTTITDESGKTWTARGNAQLDTGVASPLVNGQAVLQLDGTGDFIDTPDHADFANIKTIEMWVRLNALGALQIFASQYTDANTGHAFGIGSGNALFYQIVAGGAAVVSVTAASGFSTNTWYHVAVVHNGTDYRIWKDGASLASVTDADNLGNYTGLFHIGASAPGVPAASFLNGRIAEFRMNTTALYTAAFVPSLVEYVPGFMF